MVQILALAQLHVWLSAKEHIDDSIVIKPPQKLHLVHAVKEKQLSTFQPMQFAWQHDEISKPTAIC